MTTESKIAHLAPLSTVPAIGKRFDSNPSFAAAKFPDDEYRHTLSPVLSVVGFVGGTGTVSAAFLRFCRRKGVYFSADLHEKAVHACLIHVDSRLGYVRPTPLLGVAPLAARSTLLSREKRTVCHDNSDQSIRSTRQWAWPGERDRFIHSS